MIGSRSSNHIFRFARKFNLKNLKYLLLVILAIAALPACTFGQSATIVGTVTDPSGAVIPSVTITVTNTATAVTQTFPTNDAGQYVVPDIAIGRYDVKASAAGFKLAERKGVVLNVNDRVRVDFQMTVGAANETVTVEGEGLNVQTDSGEQSSLINGTQITELATKNRTIYSYASLTTGAANLNPDTQVPVPVGGASGNISFNGNRPGHNLYLLDGGENSDRGGAGSSSVLPSMDAIAETQVLTSNYSAEYGLSSGGTISTVTKSGTNKYHASAWEFFQNDALQARNFFNPAPGKFAKFRYNVFGFNAGGPVPG
ncbi:MAG TPA: TonB-dependent receptor, partial [Candidatus Acidoferrum sp.]|nr:TonB-dependent receptor [Candidatus Acidoferrum sp.]